MKTMWAMLLVFILILPGLSFADPSPDIQALMDESVSMLDWGIFLIEKDLVQNFEMHLHTVEHLRKISPNVYYSWGTDQFLIRSYVHVDILDQGYSSEEAKLVLVATIKRVTSLLDTYRDSLLANFSHHGFTRGSLQGIDEDKLWSKFNLEFEMSYPDSDDSDGNWNQIKCTCKIDGTNKMFSQ